MHSLLEFADGGVRSGVGTLRQRAPSGVRRVHGPRLAGRAYALGLARGPRGGAALPRAPGTAEGGAASFPVRLATSRPLHAHNPGTSRLPRGRTGGTG